MNSPDDADQEPNPIPQGYPTGHGSVDDNNSNLSVDFGFVRYDYGDLPDTYSTLKTSNGARHIIDNITYFGSAPADVDAEADGKPSVNRRRR